MPKAKKQKKGSVTNEDYLSPTPMSTYVFYLHICVTTVAYHALPAPIQSRQEPSGRVLNSVLSEDVGSH